MNLLLDTNSVLNHLRGGVIADHIEQNFDLFAENSITAISVMTLGEIYSIALQRKWVIRKLTS